MSFVVSSILGVSINKIAQCIVSLLIIRQPNKQSLLVMDCVIIFVDNRKLRFLFFNGRFYAKAGANHYTGVQILCLFKVWKIP